jgi:hypothetical protein
MSEYFAIEYSVFCKRKKEKMAAERSVEARGGWQRSSHYNVSTCVGVSRYEDGKRGKGDECFRRSTHCSTSACVGQSVVGGQVRIGDVYASVAGGPVEQVPNTPTLVFSGEAWQVFIRQVQDGAFDLPT